MRRVALLVAMLLVVVACGDDDAATTTLPPEDTVADTTPAETTVPSEDTVADTVPPDTEAAETAGPVDCRDIWPEATVTSVAGAEFTLTDTNADASACVFGLVPGIALAWRTSSQAGFEQSRSGATATGEVTDVAVCDAGFVTEIQETIIIMEGYSSGQGRAYNATISGADLAESREWAQELIGLACGVRGERAGAKEEQ